MVSVDVAPDRPGVQSTLTVPPGASVAVDLVASGLTEEAPLNGFELDLLFDASVLEVLGVEEGGFLAPPVFTLQEVLGSGRVELAAVSLGPVGVSGAGLLATVHFAARSGGVSALGLERTLLAAPFGEAIAIGALEGAGVRVGAVEAPIPEPSAGLVFGLGALGLGVWLGRRALPQGRVHRRREERLQATTSESSPPLASGLAR